MGLQIPETGGRIFWTGTNATIPANWEEDAAFASRYLQGDTTTYAAPANAGGTHTHASDPVNHTHTGNPHDHDNITATSITHGTVGATFGGPRTVEMSDDAHAHAGGSSPVATITYSTTAMPFNGDETHPDHVRIIVINIVAASGDQDIPDDGVVLSDNTVLPADFAKLASLNGKFLRAVAATGNSDLTGAGSATHTHLHPSPGHTHSPANHGHAGADGGDSDFVHAVDSDTTGSIVQSHTKAHHPSVSLDDVVTTLSTVIGSSDATSSEPAFIELLPLQVNGAKAPVNGSTIIPYVSSHASIPDGWSFYAAADSLQVKCTTTDVAVGNTGGANLHTHTSSHSHTHSSHTHTGTSGVATTVLGKLGLSDVITTSGADHTHVWSANAETPTIIASGPTLDSQDKRAAYRTVIWIKKTGGKRITLGTIHKTLKEVVAG